AVGARNHLLGLAAFALVLRAIGFWLDRYELLYSPRGVVFGASYTDVHASLPALGALAAISLLCAAACVLQIGRGGWGFLVAGLVVLAVVWVGGLGIYPALLQRLQVTPNELDAEPGVDQRAPDLHPRLRAGGGACQSHHPRGAARPLRAGHPPRGQGRDAQDHAAGDLLRGAEQRVRHRSHEVPGAELSGRRSER